MLLISHIAVALLGLAFAAASALRPSSRRLRATLALTGLTFYSGTLLVVRTHAPVASACFSGVAYLAAVTIAAMFGYWRLGKSL